MPKQDELVKLQEQLGYVFQNEALFKEALTHKSSTGTNAHYERLEFLGDRVLGLVISTALFEHFKSEDQGALTKRFHALVQQEPLAKLARKLDLQHIIITDKAGQARLQSSVLSDVIEALIAAIYLDGGYECAKKFILKYFDILHTTPTDEVLNPKSALQEWALARKAALPFYEVVSVSGPDHSPSFSVMVMIDNFGEATGQGTSKKHAEREAARILLSQLKK